jgi:hypothetical protein
VSAHHDVPLPTREEILRVASKPLPKWLMPLFLVLAAVGLLVFLIGAVTGEDRAWHALLYNWTYFTLISSAGVAVVAVQRITTARWSRPVVRFLEGYVAFLPVAFVILLLIVTVGREHIFPWAHEAPHVPEKALYLSPGFFVPRVLVVFLIITGLSIAMIWSSVRLDVAFSPEAGAGWARGMRARMRRGLREERREIHSTHSRQGVIAVLLALAFGFGWCVLAFDLSMTIDVHFQSTLYPWWVFMGGWVAAIMLWALLVMTWRRFLGETPLIGESHFHDIGKLCFAFTAFWGYLTFGQYLVIWYGNFLEETHWFYQRLVGPWAYVSVAAVVFAFVLPFFGLLARSAKVFRPTLAFFAACSLVGIWTVRYLEIYPSLHPTALSLPFGLWEIGVFVMYVGLWGLCYVAFMNAFPRMRVVMMTSPFRDEIQVPVDPDTMEPLPAHE